MRPAPGAGELTSQPPEPPLVVVDVPAPPPLPALALEPAVPVPVEPAFPVPVEPALPAPALEPPLPPPLPPAGLAAAGIEQTNLVVAPQ